MTAAGAITKGDQLVERGAAALEGLARKVAAKGGSAAKLAEPLSDDAVFLRKLKPSLVAARLRGESHADGEVTVVAPRVAAGRPGPPASATPPAPRHEQQGSSGGGGGPSPIVIAGAAFVVGMFLAKFIDWRGHAHPRH